MDRFSVHAFSVCPGGEIVAKIQNSILGPCEVFAAARWIFCHIDVLQLIEGILPRLQNTGNGTVKIV
jgi:hypothetical protein